jgi:hypothetical protein
MAARDQGGSGAGGARPARLITNATRKLKASDAERVLSFVAPATDFLKVRNNEEIDSTRRVAS